jgi:hypothetical protein
VYDRRYHGNVLSFEASGGLMNSALVMRDRPTDSWWSIMTGKAIGGVLDGTALKEIPVSEKVQWGEWKRRYPATMVLSVDGVEHDDHDPYRRYFASERTFRDSSTPDTRLPDKESIYAFQLNGIVYAAPHAAIEGGSAFQLGNGREVFLYREPGSEMFASTFAYLAAVDGEKTRFILADGRWSDIATRTKFSKEDGFPSLGTNEGSGDESASADLAKLEGFDTFWYIWSATHPGVIILE